jgi:hypothetical protein
MVLKACVKDIDVFNGVDAQTNNKRFWNSFGDKDTILRCIVLDM